MSKIPKNRQHLIELVEQNFAKLAQQVRLLDFDNANRVCVDELTIKDILAIRLWWCKAVCDWIEAGRKGIEIALPAEGYTWQQTPALNADIAENSQEIPYNQIIDDLYKVKSEIMRMIDQLDDRELTELNMFSWTDKWPVMRWISVNTSTQFETAAAYIRKALK